MNTIDISTVVYLPPEEVYDVLQTASSELQSLDGVESTKTYISLE